MIAVVVALVLGGGIALVALRRHRTPPELWLWLLAEVQAHSAGGADVSIATVGVCLHGPPRLRSATEAALRAHPGGDDQAILRALRRRVDDEVGEHAIGGLAAVLDAGARMQPVLANLAETVTVMVDDLRALDRVAARAVAARWLLLAPVVPVAAGRLAPVGAWIVTCVALIAWWLAGRALRPPAATRVFAP